MKQRQVNYDRELGREDRYIIYILRIGERGREQSWGEKMAWVLKEVSIG